MLVDGDKKELRILLLLSSEVNRLGIMLQTNIAEQVGLNEIYSTVSVDVINKLIWLRVELINPNLEQTDKIFENDLLNIKVDNNVIFLTATVYSNYGLDNIIDYHDKVGDFNLDIFEEVFPSLLSCIKEHVNYYI